MGFTLLIDPKAIQDIQEAIDYYDEQQAGLGQQFEAAVNKHLLTLEKNHSFESDMMMSDVCQSISFPAWCILP